MNTITQYSPEYPAYIRKQWELFQQGKDVHNSVRPLIYASWQRSKQLNINPHKVPELSIRAEELIKVLDQEKELLDIAVPILEDMFRQTLTAGSCFAIANTEGIILYSVNDSWKKNGNYAAKPGIIMSESHQGTAGIATCLYTKKPIEVFAGEHYSECFHNQFCVGVPLLGPEGALRGAVSISGKAETFHQHTLPLLQTVSKAITEQLRLHEILEEQSKLLEGLDEGVMTFNPHGVITFINGTAKKMLGYTDYEKNFSLEKILGHTRLYESILNGKAFANAEVGLPVHVGKKTVCTCAISYTPLSQKKGGILTLRDIVEMHDYASRTTGSKATYSFTQIIGHSERLRHAREIAEKIAPLEGSILILGESGTGKEMFAQSIHNASYRCRRPFIAINCGAIPRELIQAELFGYVEGAFTGAQKHGSPGKFELADGGTIFLDEIGEMSMEAQVSLLRVLQSHEVTRVGGSTARSINVRVIAATNRELMHEIQTHNFREDLYYRLNTFSLNIPALRDRRDDIEELVQNILERLKNRHTDRKDRQFTSAAMKELKEYSWPGNVRELENAVERAFFLSSSTFIDSPVLEQKEILHPHTLSSKELDPSEIKENIHQITFSSSDEKHILFQIMEKTGGNVSTAAKLLGIGKTTLYTMLIRVGIRASDFRKKKKFKIFETKI